MNERIKLRLSGSARNQVKNKVYFTTELELQ